MQHNELLKIECKDLASYIWMRVLILLLLEMIWLENESLQESSWHIFFLNFQMLYNFNNLNQEGMNSDFEYIDFMISEIKYWNSLNMFLDLKKHFVLGHSDCVLPSGEIRFSLRWKLAS